MPVDLGPQKIIAAARSSDGLSDQTAHTVEVEGLAALCFEVTDSEDPIEVGGMTEYIVRVGNQGTKAASGVRLVATLLGDLEPVEARGPAAHRIDTLTVVFEPLAPVTLIQELQELFSHPYRSPAAELATTYDRLKPREFFNAGGVAHYSCSS